ncbi:LOB domain-containing protein 27-like [Musa acuminata AAA Group]|uniref:LOB domain-containing protein 27-like n=1 Tax=Musa acuminata AAA Group TaxID=214697 RepID=UPI0031DA9DDD
MTVKGGTNQSCAACKYQRRRCAADCPLAAYFPADQPKQFLNCHRLFGVSNILKIINRLDPPQQAEAMKSIIYEANIRDRDPVHGCLGLICSLHLHIHHLEQELEATNSQLLLHRHHQLAASSSSSSSSTMIDGAASYLLLDNGVSIVESCSIADNNDINMKAAERFWAHHSSALHAPMDDEISPSSDAIDEDGAYESCSESPLKDTMHSAMAHVSRNELKSAAACFTLTSAVN